jgi:methionyl-tRNA formyltransferase
MKLTNIILSEKEWNRNLISMLEKKYKVTNWLLINNKNDFNSGVLSKYNIDKIFIPHWSYIIPEAIYSNYECVVFHMTDLPYGRGGSPLQNLIVRGHTETKISAIRVVKELDVGPIYLKRDLSLVGTAKEIFNKANGIIEVMISEIIAKDLQPKAQEGEIVNFKRRKPEQSNMDTLEGIQKAYDHIRMLDADGYPSAFLETATLKFEFTNANYSTDEKIITAHVRIFKK